MSLNPTETRIVDFVSDTKLAQDTRAKGAVVIQRLWRQYKSNIAIEKAGHKIVLVKMHPVVLSAITLFSSALRAQNLSGLDVNTEKTYRGIDAIQGNKLPSPKAICIYVCMHTYIHAWHAYRIIHTYQYAYSYGWMLKLKGMALADRIDFLETLFRRKLDLNQSNVEKIMHHLNI